MIRIYVGATEITPDVIWADAKFISQSNGKPGTCWLRIKDPVSSGTTTPLFPDIGDNIRLVIDGANEWQGYVIRRSWDYAFPVQDTGDYQTLTRFLTVEGVDYNILFSRRFVFDQNNPTQDIPIYDQGVTDEAMIDDLIANYVDLPPEVDVTTGITNVGTPGFYEDFKAAAVGDNFGSVMMRITLNLGSIFYIDPDLVFRYVDDETITAPYPLSDAPGVGERGYREMRVRSSAEVLCNVMTVRGAGVGSPKMVVSLVENVGSINTHGRWEYAELRNDMYKQQSADRRANTYVNGSPQNKRGHKDDWDTVTCTVYEQGYRVGQVVDFSSSVHGYSDNVPIRQATITFPTHEAARWDLSLSHEIDPGLVFADWPGPPGKKHLPWGESVDCGGLGTLTDIFDRTVSLTPQSAFQYNLWNDWGEWRDIEPGAGETWAHGEFLLLDAPVDPYGRWAEVWWSDIVYDDPGSPGFGNSYPATPPPGVAYTRHAGFRRYEYNTTDAGSWGTSGSGHVWEVYQPNVNRPIQLVVDGGRGIYTVRPYSGTGTTLPGGVKTTLGSPSYPIEIYFESEVHNLHDNSLTASQIIEWSIGDAGGASDSVFLQANSIIETDNNWYLNPAGSASLPSITTGSIDRTLPFAVRIRIESTMIYVNVWQLSDPEPFGWGGSATRSGTVADTFMMRSSTPGNVVAYLDNLTLSGFTVGCSYATTHPFVEGTLRGSYLDVPVQIVEGGDQHSFVVVGYGDGQDIQVTYVRSDAYENGPDDQDIFDDPGDPDEDPGGGGGGVWRWPASGRVTQEYGCTGFYLEPPRGSCDNFHDGIDIANVLNTPLRAPEAGEINFVGWNPWDSANPAFIVILDIPGGYQISLSHLQPIYVVSAGQSVSRGQLIGYMGSTGNSTGSHTHFEARYNGLDFNPRSKTLGDP